VGAATAHPGDSQSDHSDNGHRSDNRGRGDSRDGSKRGNDNSGTRGERGRGGDNDGRKGGGGNPGRNGGGNSNRNDDYGDDDRYTESDDGNGGKWATTGDAGQRSVSASSRGAQVATASLSPDTSYSADTVDVPTVPISPVEKGGSDSSGTPSAHQFTPPRVVFGNGRTPAPPEPDAQPPRVTYSVPDVAPASPPPPPPLPSPAPAAPVAAMSPPSWVVRIAAPTVAPQLVGVTPADWVDPLFGLTGLLLIPIAGASLGYRQARAAQHAKRFRQVLPQT
jgi:hypothetical protein